MKIYADVFFAVNLFTDYLLLLTLKRLLNLKTRGIKMFAASLLGGVTSLLVFLPIEGFLNLLLFLTISVIISGIAFTFRSIKTLAVSAFGFNLLSIMLSGLTTLFINTFSIKAAVIKGKVYYDISFTAFPVLVAVFYLLFTLSEKIKGTNKEEALLHLLTLNYKGKETSFKVLLDTGNGLKEPFSGDKVIIAEKRSLEKILPENIPKLNFLRLIPYKSVKGEGILYAFKPDKILIDGKESEKSYYVAISETEFTGGYKGILPY